MTSDQFYFRLLLQLEPAGIATYRAERCCPDKQSRLSEEELMKLNLLVFYGSVRSTRQGIKAARFVANKCLIMCTRSSSLIRSRSGCRSSKMYKEYPPGGAPELLERWPSV